MEKIQYPIRINRYLYVTGVCSRREADRLIEKGKVFVNGKKAVLGQKVEKDDKVTTTKDVSEKKYRYFLFNKPCGVVSNNPQRDEKSVEDVSGLGKSVFPIGRLDKESHGLMLLSDDGRIVDSMLNPKFGHEREYEIRVDKRITESALSRMQRGVNIEGYITKKAKVNRIDERSFSIALTEGKKHQIRRMAAALGYQVKDLKRVRIMHLELRELPEGKNRALTKKESADLLDKLRIRSRE